MTRRPHRRAAVLLGVAAVALAACAAPVPQPSPAPVPAVAPPATTIAQSDNVLSDLGTVLAAGDTALDPALLTTRVAGPALAIRSAEYVRAQATANAKPPTVIPTKPQALILPQTTAWPRTQLVVTEQPDDLQAPRILVLLQNEPRDQYHLWGWGRMGPGIPMPPTATPETGSAVLAPDATGLLATPTDVLIQYCDVLTNGAASPYAATFAPDALRTGIEAARASTVAGVGTAGTATETYTPEPAPLTTLATVDGGAIVVGQLTTVSTVSLTAGGSIPILDPFYAVLTGKQSASSNLVRTFTDVVIIYVPPAGSTALMQVLAAEHAVTAVTAD
ncbi:hypothetical protein [Cellulomonas sp. URHE0023]|uniref:hypothetical protein n=1 Tax=Cellulomonas sp. URHE0023 TaxID=1380354 RepID=UPI00048477FF|nr:hypothetical protein [Cellulomonas sp. URHE0023]